jgi:hypothetical protein
VASERDQATGTREKVLSTIHCLPLLCIIAPYHVQSEGRVDPALAVEQRLTQHPCSLSYTLCHYEITSGAPSTAAARVGRRRSPVRRAREEIATTQRLVLNTPPPFPPFRTRMRLHDCECILNKLKGYITHKKKLNMPPPGFRG